MNAGQDLLRPEALQVSLDAMGLDEHDLIYRDTTGSTNIDVIQHYQNSGRLSIAVSEAQSAGRGRRGREWLSPYATNIYCTIGFELAVEANRLGLMSISSGIALCRALNDGSVNNVRLKWPNDLVYVDGADRYKLGGILTESRQTRQGYFIAVGFGINVHMSRQQLAGVPQAATSLSLISNSTVHRQVVLIDAIAALVKRFESYRNLDAESLIEEFSHYDAYHNQPVCVLDGDDRIGGTCLGIDRSGRLLVETDGVIESFSAAEISLRAASDVIA